MDTKPSSGLDPEPSRRRRASPPLAPPPPPPAPPPQTDRGPCGNGSPPNDALSVLALVLGVMAVAGAVLCVLPGPVCGIPAVVVGLVSQHRIAASEGALGGAGLALAAWICGFAGILISAVYVALFAAGILTLGNLGYLQSG